MNPKPSTFFSSFDPQTFNFYEGNVLYQPGDGDFPPIAVDDHLDVYVNGFHYTTLILNPVNLEETVVGLLLGDGIVRSPSEIVGVRVDLEGKRVEALVSGSPSLRKVYVEDCSSLATTGVKVDSNLRVSWDAVVGIYVDFNRRTISVTRGLAMQVLYQPGDGDFPPIAVDDHLDVYVNGKWFAYLPIEVGREPPKSNRKGYVKPNYRDRKGRIVNPRSIKQRDPIGDEKAFMDMGLNNLFAVVTTNGYVLLVKGGVIKSEYYWRKREISTY
jgi:hypothetical protein